MTRRPAARRLLTGLALGALAVVAGVLRMPPLAPSSLWLDDAWASLAARASTVPELLMTGATAPGFAVLQRGVFEVAGLGELQAQLLPFVAGALGAPAAWLAGRRFGLRAGGAAVAAAVVLCAPMHVTFSSRAKAYTLDVLLGLVVLGVAAEVVRRPRDARRWALLAAVGALALLVSGPTAPTVAAAFAAAWAAALAARGSWRGLLTGVATRVSLVFAASAAAIYLLLLDPASPPGLVAYWVDFYLPRTADWPAAAWDGLAGVATALLPLPGSAGATVLLASAVVVVARRPLPTTVALLGPLAVTVVLATLHAYPLGGGRTDIHLLASLALLLGAAADDLVGLVVRVAARVPEPAAGTALAGVVTVGLLLAAPAPEPYPQEDVRPLVDAIERERAAGDGVLVYSSTRWAYSVYTERPVQIERTSAHPTNFAAEPVDAGVHVLGPHRERPAGIGPDVLAAACGFERVWFVASHLGPEAGLVAPALADAGWRQVQERHRPGALLQLWERGPATPDC